jgi:cystathionine beta-lyase
VLVKYNFDNYFERRGTGCFKWDFTEIIFGEKDILPMWVADMDFPSPQPVIDALRNRAEHGAFGYPARTQSYYDSIINWMYQRHGWSIKKEWIAYSPGVVPALSMSVIALTNPGDKVLVQSPVYYPFFSAIKANGRELINNPLRFENNSYKIDFEDLERKLSSSVKLMIFCNPHNPVGRVYTLEELKQIGELCIKYNTTILSDEIHSDIVYKGYKHIPIASICEEFAQNTVTCMAPSKTFNIAGLSTAEVIIANEKLRSDYTRIIEGIGINTSNIFGIVGLEAAYRFGGEWLEQLIDYIEGNVDFLDSYLKSKIPFIKMIKPEGTYLAWLDCRGLGMDQNTLKRFMANEAHVGLNNGTAFGECGEGFMRINLGCPRSILKQALERISVLFVS